MYVLFRGLPGTRYDFTLYYTNSTILNFPAWKASITTAPDPPSNLSIEVTVLHVKDILSSFI